MSQCKTRFNFKRLARLFNVATETVVFFKWRSSNPKYRQSIPTRCFPRHKYNLVRISKEECFEVIKSSRNSLSGMPSWDKADSLCCLKCTSWNIGLLIVLWDSRLSLPFFFGSSCVHCISLWLEMGRRVPLASTPLHLCPTSLLDCLPTHTSRWVSSTKVWWLCDSDSELASGVGWTLVGLLDH